MASENETVEEIVCELRDWNKHSFLDDYDHEWCILLADRIEAAYQRDVAKLEHWIPSAARWIKSHDIYHTSGDDLIKQAKEILNDNGEFLFKKGE